MEEERPVICIHHTDPDGFASAAIVCKKHPNTVLIPYNYEEYVGFLNRVPDGSLVYIVDTSFPNEVLKKLNLKVDLVWLDHHDTAIKDEAKDIAVQGIKGKRQNGVAGCELTWEYCFPNEPMPPVIRCIGRYDVWDITTFPEPLIFQLYLTSRNLWISAKTLPEWLELISMKDISSIIERFTPVYEYEHMQNEITAKSICYDATILNHKCIVANRNRIGSNFFEGVLKPEHSIMVSWIVNKRGMIKYTLFTNDPDLHMGEIVQKLAEGTDYKCGGHRGVASLTCNKILFPKKDLSSLKSLTPTYIQPSTILEDTKKILSSFK